jgi:hypothetical protein
LPAAAVDAAPVRKNPFHSTELGELAASRLARFIEIEVDVVEEVQRKIGLALIAKCELLVDTRDVVSVELDRVCKRRRQRIVSVIARCKPVIDENGTQDHFRDKQHGEHAGASQTPGDRPARPDGQERRSFDR